MLIILIIYYDQGVKIKMRQQMQAEYNLQAQSLQLTHYLNDWIIEDPKKKLIHFSLRNGLNSSQRYTNFEGGDKKRQKQGKETESKFGSKDKDKQREKAEVCRIQFPIIEQRSKSSKDLILPLIRPRINLNYQQPRTRMLIARSQQKIKKNPTSVVFNKTPASSSSSALQKQKEREKSKQHHHNELLKKIKRKRKRSPKNIRNPQNQKNKIQFDVSEIKALLIRELKNSRSSAKKDLNTFVKQY